VKIYAAEVFYRILPNVLDLDDYETEYLSRQERKERGHQGPILQISTSAENFSDNLHTVLILGQISIKKASFWILRYFEVIYAGKVIFANLNLPVNPI
jgi:hypothetical protein